MYYFLDYLYRTARSTTVITLLLLTLSGCSSSPKVSPSFTEEEALRATKFLLERELRINEIVRICQSGSHAIQVAVQAQLEMWHEETWDYTAAANRFYLQQLAIDQSEQGDIEGQLNTLKMKMEALELEGQSLTELIISDADCDHYLEPFKWRSEVPLIDSAFLPILEVIRETHRNFVAPSPHPVVAFRTNLEAKRRGGKSYLALEETLYQRDHCEHGFQLLTLFNQWPNEIYGLYCNNSAPTAIICTWGRCDFNK